MNCCFNPSPLSCNADHCITEFQIACHSLSMCDKTIREALLAKVWIRSGLFNWRDPDELTAPRKKHRSMSGKKD
ncbi:hypothetical protein CPB84DRAFT_1782915 [Gymnopilus junonius]|uniref:Uncharacterized protein n=1 Tax=Gymnopilus junonius TaxID=109634 RepID=A0A9P5NJU2_GYMJU|nr:hypothetical protein CPB84DRAFT_1782915 [Gymnopilus junonius]